MFVWRYFREDGKLRREKWKENLLMGVWLKGEREKNMVGPTCFFSRPTKIFSFQNGEKTKKRKLNALKRLEYPYASAHGFSFLYQIGFSFFPLWFLSQFVVQSYCYYLFFLFFSYQKISSFLFNFAIFFLLFFFLGGGTTFFF